VLQFEAQDAPQIKRSEAQIADAIQAGHDDQAAEVAALVTGESGHPVFWHSG